MDFSAVNMPFSKVNAFLEAVGEKPINWQIPESLLILPYHLAGNWRDKFLHG